ncbi:AbiH family protein [Acinetobacter baumannii]|uniref:AbiH family protein n=1 Tax=Acinetobacter baumannii TaxID=470 RepID=UPI00144A9221|nr:AbiH family protein [Acinetobacter baumannii]NLP55346.1 hypothetical protein [Acinetobacter baumannii]QNT87622.1 hypothetical protein H0N27_12320 [Acinetobacter baumannii]WEX34729.1 AbiH family protein [Acinetobacter baumannii]WEX38102.1 AbiH family protein [Acinetobacter baumannii]WEX39587.1 AbiH family protein [Acinetobacter baumannii]
MNILIIGNGFDLSHFLPTKYDHFMAVMRSIEECSPTRDMYFEDIFKYALITDKSFLEQTKNYYNNENIKITKSMVKEIKSELKANCWYQYFSVHSKEVKTWIDFEQKIEEALLLVADALKKIDDKYALYGKFDFCAYSIDRGSDYYFFSKLHLQLLSCLGLINSISSSETEKWSDGRLSKSFFTVKDEEKFGFNHTKFLSALQTNLNKFIDLFNWYIQLIIHKLEPIQKFHFNESNIFNTVFSFNYTHTYEKIYGNKIDIKYLHGKSGETHNLVLGISEITNDSLKKLKMYGFTKYHQKLLKDTHYLFLNEIDEIKDYNLQISELEKTQSDLNLRYMVAKDRTFLVKKIAEIEDKIKKFTLNIHIWGHSLDVSDADYINEIFDFNNNRDDNVRVTVYYFNEAAKFDLLANLIHILKKDKVERWMKNGWLEFYKNPTLEFIPS